MFKDKTSIKEDLSYKYTAPKTLRTKQIIAISTSTRQLIPDPKSCIKQDMLFTPLFKSQNLCYFFLHILFWRTDNREVEFFIDENILSNPLDVG